MGSFSGLGIGLSFVFGCILMGLVGELYYLLWWKKRISYGSSNPSAAAVAPEIEGSCFLFFSRKRAADGNPCFGRREQQPPLDLEVGSAKDGFGAKGFGEEGIESEIMRMHNLCGPPRFLCTIKEESREDLESEDGRRSRKGSRTKSLSDFFLTPLSSPTIKANTCLSDSYNGGDVDHQHNHGFNNPLFEEGRFGSSPPPKLKFLKDAEDKLIRKLLAQEAERKSKRVIGLSSEAS